MKCTVIAFTAYVYSKNEKNNNYFFLQAAYMLKVAKEIKYKKK